LTEIADDLEVTALTSATERLIIAGVKADTISSEMAQEPVEAISTQIADDFEVPILTRSTKRLIVTGVQLDATSMEIADDFEVPILRCSTEWFIIACSQVSATTAKPTNGMEVALVGGFTNSLIQRPVLGVLRRMKNSDVSQRTTRICPRTHRECGYV
jgi:hypothetical protein